MISQQKFIMSYLQVPDEDKKYFLFELLRTKGNLHLFAKFFFPHIIKSKIAQCHLDLITEISNNNDSTIIYPRGFGKTTWEKIDTLHDIVYALEPVILYVSNTITDAQFHFESIKAELENNELLVEVYGDLVPNSHNDRKWTNKHFETRNKINVIARGACKGRGVNIKNQRPTKIILDDCEDDEMVRSADRRLKYQEWLYNVIVPSKDVERGKIKMIGTVISTTAQILKFYKKHGGIFKKAIENGKSIWEDVYSLDYLGQMKEKYGTRMFSQEYMNNPVNEETSLIKRKWLEASTYIILPRGANMKKVIMFDPQSGESKSSDYYGLCVMGYWEKDIHRYILETQIGRKSQREQAELVIQTWQKHREAHMVGIEKVLNQVAVYQYILDWKAGKVTFDNVNNLDRNIPVIAVSPQGKDKTARLQMHEASFERGEVHLHVMMTRLIDTLVSFPDCEHDDEVDSLVYCLEKSHTSNFVKKEENIYNKSILGNIYAKKF